MLVRSPEFEDRIPDTTQLEIFTLPIEAARRKARGIIDRFPQVVSFQSSKIGDNLPTDRLSSRSASAEMQTAALPLG